MLLTSLYIIGITAEGMTGALAAGRHNMDWFGVLFIACVTAIGGGSIRDVLFGHYPLTWVAHPEYLAIICVAALLTTKIPYFVARFERTFLVLDALGLAVFSVIGARIGLELHPSGAMAVAGAIITGVFGGILRDIFCARIPLVFQKELYASISLLIGSLYVICNYVSKHYFALDENTIIIMCLIIGFIVRLVAIRYHLGLPTFKFNPKS
ncbi:trimeric intracellular cation channel family protein [Helicobacter sp.]|uniref:trimeric intracellular cation channel family protein n=1 Tax=Helicobacter sp. TaxID=218 RepID=UPI0025C70DC2|nr:trimeric intracellular cation channel family protein [Helicobacter sp.]MCI5968992.1 trimeric intracellular cation channel family protein [Helicobacter sp.]MDY2584132.1 trimeric intracellular cation channel family protein [Helicobacter sp.]